MEANKQKIPDLMLEKYVLGELSEEEAENIRQAITHDQQLKQRTNALRKSNIAILKKYPSKQAAKLIQNKLTARTGPASEKKSAEKAFSGRIHFVFQRLVPAMGIVIVLFVFLLPVLNRQTGKISPLENNEITRIKGSAKLYIFQKINDQEKKLSNNDKVKKGDIIQLGFMAGNNNYGVIFSLDGRKTVTLHYPYQEEGSTKLVSGKMKVLDESYELDDAPQYEIFFFIASKNRIDTRAILKKAEEIRTDPEQALRKNSRTFGDYEFMSLKLIKEKTK